MGFDSIANGNVFSAPNSKDFGKKKRANRSAKLKKCKFDARRDQWLSQGVGKSKGGEKESSSVCAFGNLEIKGRNEEINGSISVHHNGCSEWPSNSPTSHAGSVLGNDSGTNYSGSSSSRSISSSCGGCCSGSVTDEDGCLDDWETMADALAANDKQQNMHSEIADKPIARKDESCCELTNGSGLGATKPIARVPVNTKAWRPDDNFRPQSLPSLSKQFSLPNLEIQACNSVICAPASCPICCEDLDPTDSSFLPCLCGFRLCLFCHKRILEEDGRCPGCRKPYM